MKIHQLLTPEMALKTMSDMASGCLTNEQSMPCLASFFDDMFGGKKLI